MSRNYTYISSVLYRKKNTFTHGMEWKRHTTRFYCLRSNYLPTYATELTLIHFTGINSVSIVSTLWSNHIISHNENYVLASVHSFIIHNGNNYFKWQIKLSFLGFVWATATGCHCLNAPVDDLLNGYPFPLGSTALLLCIYQGTELNMEMNWLPILSEEK